MRREDVTTADQLLALRDPPYRHELVRGELRTMSPAGYWHGAVITRLSDALGPWVRAHGLGETFGAETGFVLTRHPDTVLAPDLAFVANERLPRAWTRGYFEGPPDLAVEARSPDDGDRAVATKVARWLRHGTRAVWVVDPVARTVHVHERDGRTAVHAESETLTGGGARSRSAVGREQRADRDAKAR
jgi:Uma2 family endonuclease